MTGVRRRLLMLGGGLALTMVLAAGVAVVAQDASPAGGLLNPGTVFGGPDATPAGPATSPAAAPTPPAATPPAASPGGVTASPGASSCAADTEPNDTPETAPVIDSPGCVAGTLPESDQDLFLWTVTDQQASQPWDITLDGVGGTITGVKVLQVTSDPGVTPLVIGNQILEVDQALDASGPTTLSDVLIPAGRYLVGISRSSTVDASIPVDLSYQLTIAAGAPLPPSGDVEPNDDPTTANTVSGAFAISGDLRDSQDVYRWTTSELDAGKAWDLSLAGPLGVGSQLYLQALDGSTIASVSPDPLGHAELDDLRLTAGDHILVIYPSSSGSAPYSLVATQVDLGSADPEPNGTPTTAVPIDAAHPVVHGRLTPGDPKDWYALDVNDTLGASLLDIRLIWRTGPSRRLCLADAAGNELQCRVGNHGVSLSGLHLQPGPITIEVSGDPSATSSYLLRIDATTAPAADFESEPNDDPRTASVVSGLTMRGQFATDDRDTFQVTTTGVPQLWQVDLTGTGITGLMWENPDGTDLGDGAVATDHQSAQLTDLYLIPGEHWLRVDGSNGDYTVALTPLGPPDPNGEREPNNQAINAEPLSIGSVRSGRLPSAQDADVFRLTVDTPDHVRISVTPPADGAIDMRLESGSLRDADITGDPGVPIVYDALLQPGDYELWLLPGTPSLGKYSVTVEREDPFLVSTDQEPDDDIGQARPLPPSLHIDGDAPTSGDEDWYQLGTLPNGGDLAVRTTGAVLRLRVSDGVTDYEGVLGDGGQYVVTGLPSGVPLWLHVDTNGAYGLDIDPGATGLAPAVPLPAPPAVTMTLTTDEPAVAAFWSQGQMVTGTLTLTSTASSAQQLTLDWATSDPGWTLEPAQQQVDLGPGDSVPIPVTIDVLPDAAVDDAVRLTIRARDASGGQATAWTNVASDPDAAPVGTYQAWSVPAPLLGGLDVASAALGGTPVVSIDAAAEAQLYDGVTPSGSGFQATMSGTPLTVTVDLAGDAPVPVAGMILNPLGGRGSIEPGPRAVALLLSDDGATWQQVLSGELSPLTTDQYFVLPAPIPARFAQLRIDSTWGGTSGPVTIGEWKVIAAPGAVPDSMPANIADPIRGGHIVWMDPPAGAQSSAQTLLTDDPTEYAQNIGAEAGTAQTIVIGFQDDRQALLTGMEWVDPTDSNPAERMRNVQVAISTTSPVGPWQAIGTWDLKRAGDGSVAPFSFDTPTWARFVQLTGTPLKKGYYSIEEPATIRILEAPTSDAYRSILGEWGFNAPVGPHDWITQSGDAVAADLNDGDNTPETARPLIPGTTAAGRVHRDQDVDWYSIAVPTGQNSISIDVGGVPTVGVSLTLFDLSGQEVPMTFGEGTDGGLQYQANVTAGATYRVRVQQPPFSAVFAFDTSASMGNYLPFVYQALRAYTGGVVKGDEEVKVQPFEEQTLLPDWSDDAYLLQDAVDRYVVAGGSSSAETALIDASKQLAGREGARAILLVTDAETSSYQRVQELWASLGSIRPIVFSVHVGSDSTPDESRHFMQDWSAAGGGFYQYVVSHGEMDQAFARMATWLRRPAAYTLDVSTSDVQLPPPPPGTLSVTAAVVGGAPTRAPARKDVAVDIILDTSGSMLDRFGGQSRITIAKKVLDDLVTNQLPAGAPIALRVLGDQADPCSTRLAVPFGPLDAGSMTALVDRLKVVQAANTPIGAALEAVPGDLKTASGTKIVLLITDSKEIWPNRDLCGKNPQTVIRQLVREGIDARINIVGLAVGDKRARRQMSQWARLGGGAYFDARNPKQLGDAIRAAVSAPFEVFDASGASVATGTVGGAAVQVPPGTYRVAVLSDPGVSFDGIVVASGGSVTLTLPPAAGPGASPAPGASPGPGAGPGPSPAPGASPAPGLSPAPGASPAP